MPLTDPGTRNLREPGTRCPVLQVTPHDCPLSLSQEASLSASAGRGKAKEEAAWEQRAGVRTVAPIGRSLGKPDMGCAYDSISHAEKAESTSQTRHWNLGTLNPTLLGQVVLFACTASGRRHLK